MKLFLIRHGETVDNVAGKYAGITNSALTNHGVLQAQRLAHHFLQRDIRVTTVFSSDLQRAYRTAEAIRLAQAEHFPDAPTSTTQALEIREQDFGYYEGKIFIERPKDSNKSGKESHQDAHRNDPGFQDVESKDAMKLRCNRFIDAYLQPILLIQDEEQVVVIVAHGIILSHLWRCLLGRFRESNVSLSSDVTGVASGFSLQHLGGWSNTGYLELAVFPRPDSTPTTSPLKRKRSESVVDQIPVVAVRTPETVDNVLSERGFNPALEDTRQSPPIKRSNTSPHPISSGLSMMKLVVRTINCVDHLKGLKKTRGGIGSLKHDENQKTISSFFKKRKS